jgi:EAL and modified HD-GYP domain-containing signal transduction protein
MKVFAARQAIFDRDDNVVGYELFFRDGKNNSFPDIDPDKATASLIMGTHLADGLNAIGNGKTCLINFPEKSLLNGTAKLLPTKGAAIEILEEVTPSPEVYKACVELVSLGHQLILDDFIYSEEWEMFFPLIAMIKIDIMHCDIEVVSHTLEKLKKHKHLKFLAEKVETKEEHDLMFDMGFHFFQGYFYCRPEVKEINDLETQNPILMLIYNEVMCNKIDYSRLNNLFSQDISLTVKLLQYINGSNFKARTEITSIKGALVYLGDDRVRKFIALFVQGTLNITKPNELLTLSIQRARFCELITKKVAPGLAEQGFFVGLLSLLDAILDQPLETLLSRLPLAEEIKDALLSSNPSIPILQNALNTAISYEKGQWRMTQRNCAKISLNEDLLPKMFASSIAWANNINTDKKVA